MGSQYFTCERCGHDGKTKGNLIQHLRKQKECLPTFSQRKRQIIIDDLTRKSEKPKVHKCTYCDQMFSSPQGKHQHGQVCPSNPQNKLKSRVLLLENRVKQLQEELKVSRQSSTKVPPALHDTKESTQDNTTSKKAKQKINHALKIKVWDTYVGDTIGKTKCFCCQNIDITQHNYHCGHVQAEAHGGTLHVDNLRPICCVCNNSMGTQNLLEFKREYFEESIL